MAEDPSPSPYILPPEGYQQQRERTRCGACCRLPMMVGMGLMNEAPWPFHLLDDDAVDAAFAPVWDYHHHESMEDLKNKLLSESLRNANEEMKLKDIEIRRKDAELKRKEEENNQLAQLLKVTTEERDIARDTTQMLLSKLSSNDLYAVVGAAAVPFQIESPPLAKVTKGYSSSTTNESDSTSSTHNHHHPFDTVTSPYMTNATMADSFMTTPLQAFTGLSNDNAGWIIDALAKQKPLPEKGKLLQAVHDVTRATPLLETLMMTGSLPEWRIPPPPLPLHVPSPVKDSGTFTNERALGGAYASVGSTAVGEMRRVLPGASSYRAIGAKRQMIQ